MPRAKVCYLREALDSLIILTKTDILLSRRSANSKASRFPNLPPEIRSMIWRLAEPDRILTANPHFDISLDPVNPVSFCIHQPQRVLNQVSREARCETTKDYIHVKASRYWFLKNDVSLNTHRDTVYFPLKGITYGSTKWLYFLGEILHGKEASISRIALEGTLLEWPVTIFKSVFDRNVVRRLDEISFVVAQTKKATRTQVFALDANIKINGRKWEHGNFQLERRVRMSQFQILLESSKLHAPTLKVMELCLEDLV